MKTSKNLNLTFFLFIAILTSLSLTSCEKRIRKTGSGAITTVTRQMPEFHELEVDGRFDVFLHIDNNPRVEITTDDNIQNEVRCFVSQGELTIEMSDDYYRYKFTKMEVHVYTANYSNLDFDGNIKTIAMDTITSPSLNLKHDGSGSSEIKYHGNSFTAKINGAGYVLVNGQANQGKFEINGSGKMDALGLPCQTADARIDGSGKIYVNISQLLNATINGSGAIRYLGSPGVNSSINGSGSISHY